LSHSSRWRNDYGVFLFALFAEPAGVLGFFDGSRFCCIIWTAPVRPVVAEPLAEGGLVAGVLCCGLVAELLGCGLVARLLGFG
jgi:hypothetical protein